MRQVGTALVCMECGAESDALAYGWRAYLAPAEDEEPEGEILIFCPECARREFGPFGWTYAGA
jgi:DNA-directed RNA polymerase subunit RPC12/RpoP